MKQTIDIESFLRVAYRDELPKGYRDGKGGAVPEISPMFRYANLGGPVDNWSREPGFPIAMGTTPHPDAITIHNAVMALDELVITWPSAADMLLGDLAKYLTDGELFMVAQLRVQTPGLVTMHARLGNRPIWQIDYNVLRVIGRNRKSILRKGRGRRSIRLQGEWQIDVPASEILTARFEYFAWHSALCELAQTPLLEFQPTPPVAPQQPWFNPEQGGKIFSDANWMDARMLGSRRASAQTALPLKPARPRVLPQRPASQHGPVVHLPWRKRDTKS